MIENKWMSKPVYKYSPINYPERGMSGRKLNSEWIRYISCVARLPPSEVGCRTVKRTRYLIKICHRQQLTSSTTHKIFFNKFVKSCIHLPGQLRTPWMTLKKGKLQRKSRRLARKWKLGLKFAYRVKKRQAFSFNFFIFAFCETNRPNYW